MYRWPKQYALLLSDQSYVQTYLNHRFRAAEVSKGHNCSGYLGHNMGPLSYDSTLYRPFVLMKTLKLLYRPYKFSFLSKDVTWVDSIKPLTDLCCDIRLIGDRSLFIWRPKDDMEVDESEATTTVTKETKVQVYEADGGKAGRAKGKKGDNDDDDFDFVKKKVKGKMSSEGPSAVAKEKGKKKSKGDSDEDDDFTLSEFRWKGPGSSTEKSTRSRRKS